MARVRLDLPPKFHYSTEIPVRITDLNYGAHVGNDAILSIIHEARVRFFNHYGYSELNIEGRSIIMSDAVIVYRSEAHYGDVLAVDVAAGDFYAFGCDLIYKLIEQRTGREVARAKTGIVFFDYEARKPQEVPENFQKLFEEKSTFEV